MGKELSPLDWLMPRYYMPQIYCFPSNDARIRQCLYDGLSRLVIDVPFLLSGVVGQEHPLGSVALSDPYRSVEDCFTWQNLSNELDYKSMRTDGFPLAVFNHHDIITPNAQKRPLPVPAPVFWARLTLVRSGAFLYVGLHHSVADMTGFGSIVKLWAAHCRAKSSSTGKPFDLSWLDRSMLCAPACSIPVDSIEGNIPRGLCYEDDPAAVTSVAAIGASRKSPRDDRFTAAIFHFSPESLEQVKKAAILGISVLGDVGAPWVSTNDVLTALLWSAVVWAERSDLPTGSHSTVSHMTFPVNIRSRWSPPLPDEYLGAAVIQTPVTCLTEDLLALSSAPPITQDSEGENKCTFNLEMAKLLARISGTVRRAVMDVNVDDVRHAIAFMAAQRDVSRIREKPKQAVIITSWADQGACEVKWGDVVGRCEAVRFATFPTKVRPIVLPRINIKEGGGLEVFLSLRTEEMVRFGDSALVKLFGSLRTSVSLARGK